MKTFLTGLILIAMTNFSHAQWFSLNSGTTKNLNGLSVVDSLTVYAVGDSGTILKTIDGGETWTQQNPIFFRLTGVSFCDQNTGMAVGDNGVILKTTDGGNVWFPLNSGITATHKFVWFHSPSNATIIQGGNHYMVTSDGGINWQSFSPYGYPWSYSFWDMGYTNWEPRRGVFVGNGYLTDPPNGPFIRVMYISANGTNWNEYLQQNTMYSFKQVSVLPNGRVFALELNSPDRIITSSTGTGNWQTRGILGDFVNDLFFVNNNSGTALKNDGIYRTSDGGWNWDKVSPLVLKSVAFADSNTGYAIGGGGAIAKTLNGSTIIDADENHISFSFQLNQNYPNPFNPATSIQYQVSSSAMVKLIVYDVMGNEIAVLLNEEKQPGTYTTEFNGAGLSSGVYFYRLTAGDRTDIKKMILLK